MPRRSFLSVLAGLVLVFWHVVALAGSIAVRSAELRPDERGQAITAEFVVTLGPRLEEAVKLGVPLHLRFEFDLTRKRRYWLDEHIAGHVLHYRLGYQALTRQYRLTLGGLHQNFETLDEALDTLGRIRRLHVIDSQPVLTPGETYTAAVRLSLDHNQLPKPLQIDALGDRDWRVEAGTLRWEFVPPPANPTPPGPTSSPPPPSPLLPEGATGGALRAIK